MGKETLTEVLFADLGDGTAKSPYLIVSVLISQKCFHVLTVLKLRSSTDELILYEPFHKKPTQPSSFTANLRFRKVPGMHLPKYNEDVALEKTGSLQVLPDVSGYAAVFMPGSSASFVIKEATSLPHVVNVRGKDIKGLCGLNSRRCETGFSYVDLSGQLHEGQLPFGARFCANGWNVRKLSPFSPDHEIRNIAYHTEHDVYVVMTRQSVDFQPPEDDPRHPAADEGMDEKTHTNTGCV